MAFSRTLLTITVKASWGPGPNLKISLIQKAKGYILREKQFYPEHEGSASPVRTVEVSSEWVNKILDELKNAKIPALPMEMLGADGAFYSMKVGDGYGGAKYTWWSVPPAGWEILSEVTNQIIDKFSRLHPD